MLNQVFFDLEKLEKDFSDQSNITEILELKSIVLRKRNMLSAESNNFMQKRFTVLKTLERNMFHQEMRLMAEVILKSYGKYWDQYGYSYNNYHLSKIVRDERKNLCLISSHGLHLTLSSTNE